MKKKIILPIILFTCGTAVAQSLDDARELLYHQRYASAAATLETELDNNPAQPEAWYWQSQAYLQQNAEDAIIAPLQAVPEGVKNHPLYAVGYGHVLLQNNKKDSATYYFDRALKDTRERDAFVLAAVAKAHIKAPEGNANYALNLLDKAIKRSKNDAMLYTLKGDAYMKLQNGSEAFKAYTTAVDKDKPYAEALYKLGNLFASQKNEELYLKYYKDAIAADRDYAPAYYALYYHHYYKDPAKAMDYYKQYLERADKNVQTDYAYTDLLYLTKQHSEAIKKAKALLQQEGVEAEPRLYKLIAYSYKDMNQADSALAYMTQYFEKAPDSLHIVKDFEAMAELYAGLEGKEKDAATYYEKALGLIKDTAARYAYYKKLADYSAKQEDFAAQAQWLGKYYEGNDKATNVDLFNWGITYYKAGDYNMADSVFGIYTAQYPDQTFGYYWRARSNTAKEGAMESGIAIPHYLQLIALAEKDSENETAKKWLIEAYGYVAAYEANTEKDYAEAIQYFEKLLALQPENEDAKKYIGILQKSLRDTTKAGD